MESKEYRVTNKLRQVLPLLLADGTGKVKSVFLPSKESRIVTQDEMSQDVLDKKNRGFVAVEEVQK